MSVSTCEAVLELLSQMLASGAKRSALIRRAGTSQEKLDLVDRSVSMSAAIRGSRDRKLTANSVCHALTGPSSLI